MKLFEDAQQFEDRYLSESQFEPSDLIFGHFTKKCQNLLNKFVVYTLSALFTLLLSLRVITSFINFPQGDTLGNGLDLHQKLQNGGTFFTAIKESIKLSRDLWFNFEGRWFSSLFYAFSPAQIDFEKFDFITGLLMTAIFVGGSVFFIKQICNAFNYRPWKPIFFAFVLSQTLFLGYIQEFNHWVGALVYVMPYGLCLLILGVLIKLLRGKRSASTVALLYLLLICVSGTNQLHVLAIWWILFMLAIAKRTKFFFISFIIYTPLALFSILAPGNFNRMNNSRREGFLHAIKEVAIYILTHNTLWTLFTIPLALICIGLIIKIRALIVKLPKFERLVYAIFPLTYFMFCPFIGFYSQDRVNWNMDNTLYYFWGIYLLYICALLPFEKLKNTAAEMLKGVLPAFGALIIVIGFFFTSTFQGVLQILNGTEFTNYQKNIQVMQKVKSGEPIQIQSIEPTVWHHPLFNPKDVDENGCAVLDRLYMKQFAQWLNVMPLDSPCVKAYK